jgi:hypothetical protein
MHIDRTVNAIVKIYEKDLSSGEILAKRQELEQIIAYYALGAIMDSSVAREVQYICESIKEQV